MFSWNSIIVLLCVNYYLVKSVPDICIYAKAVINLGTIYPADPMKKRWLILLVSLVFICSCQNKQQAAEAAIAGISSDTNSMAEERTDSENVLQNRQAEDDSAYTALRFHSGNYVLYTESEGVDATLQLLYNGDKTFHFVWKFDAPAAGCSGQVKGMLLMDRTQHGFYHSDGCMIHFEFRGLWDGHYLVDLTVDESGCALMTGDCIFSGTYMMGVD